MALPKSSIASRLQSDAILLALGTLLAYTYSYLIQFGYYRTFGIPANFISLSPGVILTSAMSLCAVLLVLFLIANIIARWWPERRILRVKFTRSCMIAAPLFWKLYLFQSISWVWLIFVVVLLAFEFLVPLVQFRRSRNMSYEEKLQADEQEGYEVDRKSLPGLIANRVGFFGYVGLFAVVVWGSFLAYDVGLARAANTRDFLVINDSQLVVLGISDGRLICATLNREAKTVSRTFSIRVIQDELRLREERVGPLKLEPRNDIGQETGVLDSDELAQD